MVSHAKYLQQLSFDSLPEAHTRSEWSRIARERTYTNRLVGLALCAFIGLSSRLGRKADKPARLHVSSNHPTDFHFRVKPSRRQEGGN